MWRAPGVPFPESEPVQRPDELAPFDVDVSLRRAQVTMAQGAIHEEDVTGFLVQQ